jgi:thymidine phosphorylase
LAESLVQVGRANGKNVRALLTSMEQPLGRTVGNALEVAESIACLRGEGPADVMEVSFSLGVQMLVLGGVATSETEARGMLERVVRNGAALEKLRAIVTAQGGDAGVIDEPNRLPHAEHNEPLRAPRGGVICEVDAMKVALAALRLGAGRSRTEDAVDPAVGVAGLVKIGERIEMGSTLCVIHANDMGALADARQMLQDAILIGDQPASAPRLVEDVL